MKLLYFMFVLFFSIFGLAQSPLIQTSSNRIIQHYQSYDHLKKIEASDPNRLIVLWNYFTASFTFQSNEENDLTIEKLLNIYHFDVYQVENKRLENESFTFQWSNSISITLLPKQTIDMNISPYSLEELVHGIPARPLPLWTENTFSPENFQAYKEKIWDWAKDFSDEYLELTNDPSIRHIHFNQLMELNEARRSELLAAPIYFIVD